MKTLNTIKALQQALQPLRRSGKTIAFVPTMGNLHEGHLALVKKAKTVADITLVSIFVNPLQFGPNEDLDKYPRTLHQDQQKLTTIGADYLFTPTSDEIYPNGKAKQTQIIVPGITERHCGQSRPGHFAGVATVVCKLFNIVQPDTAIFGQKDFQQLAVIRKMVGDLCLPVSIIGLETSRDSDGLALSSRNQYLTPEERQIAAILYKTLCDSRDIMLKEPENWQKIAENAAKTLEDSGFRVDYFNICDAHSLTDPDAESCDFAILAAAFLGNTRLIDNVYFSLNRKNI